MSERLPYSLHNADQKLDRHVLRLTAADERKKAPIDPLAGNASLIVTGISPQADGSPVCAHRGRVSSIQERKPRRGIAGVTPSDTMTWGSLRIEVRDDEIIVTQPGSNFSAVYYKPRDEPQLIAKGTPSGNYRFLARAWKAANDKARELGWIV